MRGGKDRSHKVLKKCCHVSFPVYLHIINCAKAELEIRGVLEKS